MTSAWLWVAAAMMTATAFVHAILGERRLIGPLIAAQAGVLERPLARQVTRFAWHLTSALMLLNAATIVWPGTPRAIIVMTGAVWLAVGLFDAALTKGRHVGWPALSASGLFAIVGGLS